MLFTSYKNKYYNTVLKIKIVTKKPSKVNLSIAHYNTNLKIEYNAICQKWRFIV